MSDFALDGLDLAAGVTLVEGDAAIAQNAAIRLRFFLGEWFLDRRQGVPYYRDVLGRKPNATALRSLFRRVLLSTPGVAAVTRLDVTIDRRARTVTVRPEARAASGAPLVFAPFVLP